MLLLLCVVCAAVGVGCVWKGCGCGWGAASQLQCEPYGPAQFHMPSLLAVQLLSVLPLVPALVKWLC